MALTVDRAIDPLTLRDELATAGYTYQAVGVVSGVLTGYKADGTTEDVPDAAGAVLAAHVSALAPSTALIVPTAGVGITIDPVNVTIPAQSLASCAYALQLAGGIVVSRLYGFQAADVGSVVLEYGPAANDPRITLTRDDGLGTGTGIVLSVGGMSNTLPFAAVDWTPTVTQSGAVSCTVTYAQYQVVGGFALVNARVAITGAGTGNNPVVVGGQPAVIQPSNAGEDRILGSFVLIDAGTSAYSGVVLGEAADGWRLRVHNSGTPVGQTPNFALANGDSLAITCCYWL